MGKKFSNKLKPIMVTAIGLELVVTTFLLLVTFLQLNDPVDLGYFPTVSYFIFFLRIVVLLAQSFLLYCYLKSGKKMVAVLILGGIISLFLFGINEVIALSIAFN